MSRATAALLARLGAGAVFVTFGAAKFTAHASEVESFETYGLPWPDAFVYAIGAIEVVGGALLFAGFGTRVASLILAGDMIGAITVSGIGQGELISLTLAPALLCITVFLLWNGPGRYAFSDRSFRPEGRGGCSRDPRRRCRCRREAAR